MDSAATCDVEYILERVLYMAIELDDNRFLGVLHGHQYRGEMSIWKFQRYLVTARSNSRGIGFPISGKMSLERDEILDSGSAS